MPVLLTRPASAVAAATASALLDDGAQVRLFGPAAPPVLRARGAFVATADHDDVGVLEAALAQVHTLVHVGPGILADDPARVLAEGVGAVDAAVAAGVRRIVLLSLPGAAATAGDPLRRAAGAVEDHAAASPVPTVVVRPGLVDTDAVRDAVAFLPTTPDDVVVAPVGVDDLAEALVAVDRARSRAAAGHVVFRAPGAEPLTLDQWLQRTGVRGAGDADLVGRTYRPGGSPLLLGALGGPWTEPADGRTADLWAFAGTSPRPLPRDARA